MSAKWKEKLKRWLRAIRTFINHQNRKWKESNLELAEQRYRQLGFHERRDLEESRIRAGYWGRQW